MLIIHAYATESDTYLNAGLEFPISQCVLASLALFDSPSLLQRLSQIHLRCFLYRQPMYISNTAGIRMMSGTPTARKAFTPPDCTLLLLVTVSSASVLLQTIPEM